MKLNQYVKIFAMVAVIAGIAISCQKMERPALGDYPEDTNPPGGPLKFYTAFDGTGPDVLMNAVDSIRASFPVSQPLVAIDGISGKAVKGDPAKAKAIKYPSANDFANSTSWTVAYWLKQKPATDGEPEFHFSLVSKDYWHESGLFLLVEKGGPDPGNSTEELMACKLAVEDNWAEFVGEARLPNVLNGQWHHLAFVYNETDSKVSAYVDGQLKRTLGPIKVGDNPRGAKKFSNATNFIIGGWNKQADAGGVQDPWIHGYSGEMDQFRLYGKALTAAEIQSLFNSKM